MIIISKIQMLKRDRARLKKKLDSYPTGHRVWSENIRTVDEGQSFILNGQRILSQGPYAVLDMPIQSKTLKYNWLTEPHAIKYLKNRGRDWGNELDNMSIYRQSYKTAINFVAITPVVFLFEDFILDLEAGRSLTFPVNMLYSIERSPFNRYLIYRYFMYNRYH